MEKNPVDFNKRTLGEVIDNYLNYDDVDYEEGMKLMNLILFI